MDSEVFETFLNQSFFQFISRMASKVANFVFFILISRFLGPEIFGQFSLIHSIIFTVVMFCIVGLPLTGQRFVSKASGDPELQFDYVKFILRNYIFLFAIIGLILFFGMDWLAEFFGSQALANHSIFVLGILFVFGAWKIFMGIFKGYKKIQVNAIQNSILGIGKIIFFLMFYMIMEPTLKVALGSFLVGYIIVDIGYIIFIWFQQEQTSDFSLFSWQLSKETKRELWKYSLIIFMTNIVAVVLTQTDRLMIGYYMAEKDVGYYVAAFKWAAFLLILMKNFRPISGSMFSEFEDKGNNKSLVRLYFNVMKFSFVLSFPLFVCYWLYSGWFLSWFGMEFLAAKSAFNYLNLAKLAQLIVGPVGMVLVMSGLENWDFYTNLILAIFNFLLNLLFIPWWGITGAALATFTSWTIMLICKFGIFAYKKSFFQFISYLEFFSPYLIIVMIPCYWGIKTLILPDENIFNILFIGALSGLISLFWGYIITGFNERKKILDLIKSKVGKLHG